MRRPSIHVALQTSACVLVVLLGVALQPSTATARTSVQASAQPRSLAKGDYLNYTVTVNVQGNHRIEVRGRPDFGDAFQVVGTTNAPSHIIHNGRVQKSLRRVYRLRALEEGRHRIDPPPIRIAGSEQRANAVTVLVTPPDQKSKRSRRRGSRSRDKRVFLDHEIEPTRTPYVGEQLTLTYYLYADAFRLKIDPQPPQEPSLDDFWIEDLSPKSSGQRQTMRIDGRVMERINMRTYALFPLRAGPTSIDSLALDVHTGGFGLRNNTMRLKSDPVELDVQPLPANAPDSFYEGNVGQWTFRVTADRTRAPMGRPINISLTAEGHGQVGRIVVPALPELDGSRVAGRDEDIDRRTDANSVGGSKTQKYTIVAEKEGTLTIPALEFSFFDPQRESYETVRSEPIDIVVEGGQVSLAGQELTESRRTEQQADEADLLDTLTEELAGPKRHASLEASGPPVWRHAWYWVLVLIAALGTLALWLERPLRRLIARLEPGHRRAAAYKQALARLDRAGQAPPAEALDLIGEGLAIYLVDVAGLPAGAISESELPRHLDERGVDAEHCQRVAKLVGGLSAARYSPDQEAKKARAGELRRDCRACLEALEKQRRRRQWKPAAAAAVLLAAALGAGLLVAPAQAHAADEPGQTLERAEQAQQQGDWAEAAEQWTKLYRDHPDAPDVLYNLGIALARSGEYGRARLMLERAAFYDPDDDDIDTNREVLQKMVRLRQIQEAPGTVHDNTTSERLFWWRAATSVSATTLALVLAALVWLLFMASLARRLVAHRGMREAALVVAVVTAIGVALAAGALVARAQIIDSIEPGVITVEDTPLRQAPSEHAAMANVKTVLVPGVLLPVEDQREGWVKLGFSDGTSAWTARDNVELITATAD